MGNISLATTSVANTGEMLGDKSRGVLKKVYIFNGLFEEEAIADEQSFFDTMVANSLLPKTDPNKVFVIQEAQDLADASEADKEGSLNLGFKTVLIEGKPAIKVKIFASADMLKRLRTWNNRTVRIVEYDSNNTFWTTKSGGKGLGFLAKLKFSGGKMATGQNVEEGVVEFTLSILSTSEYIDNCFYMQCAGNVEDIKALIDVNLKYISKATNVYKIGVEVAGSMLKGPYNPGSQIGSLLAALTFDAGSGAGFNTDLPITSVAWDSTLSALTVTFDNTAFGALASNAQFQMVGPDPAALDAGDVFGVELNPVVLTK